MKGILKYFKYIHTPQEVIDNRVTFQNQVLSYIIFDF
jgi:hypothetical protein